MWDSGASFNFMHQIEANLLGLSSTPSPIAFVVVGNEDLLTVEGQVQCRVAFESDPPVTMDFHVVSRLPYRTIIGLAGMKTMLVLLDASEMSVTSKLSGTSVKCITSVEANAEDTLCAYIPADVATDHDDEMDVHAASLEEVKQWADHSATSKRTLRHSSPPPPPHLLPTPSLAHLDTLVVEQLHTYTTHC
jgi:hypothetical protein